MKKTIFTLILTLFSLIVCSQTEYVTPGGIENGSSGPLSDGITALNGTGTISIKGDIQINGNITIPEGIELNFFRGNKFKIEGNITLTINGSVKAGAYQIFELSNNGTIDDCPSDNIDETLDDGKVRGNLKNKYVIPQWWGVDDTGANYCSKLFQKAIESFPNVKKFVANGTFLLDLTVWLNQDNTFYDFTGAVFIGINSNVQRCGATWNSTDDGGLINIGKNELVTSNTSPYSVSNITLHGGAYQPRHRHDNALGITNAKNIKIINVNINCYVGHRGIAIQHNVSNEGLISRTDHVLIKDVTQQGGRNVINMDFAQDSNFAKNIIISNIIGHDIDGKAPGTGGNIPTEVDENTPREPAFRISSQGGRKISNLSISNVILSYVHGGFYFDGVDGIMSNVQVIGFDQQNGGKEIEKKNSYEFQVTDTRYVPSTSAH
ncbi:hypothetical protein [Aquimarina sp. AU58]|uniref:hypothetical protein n=1 Tax=Aquimarina sp. AU58 TaxID=1874112 RepID=UPI000D6E185F|nr:hypothetical protein [Aquimarina sp. AU58]